MKKMSRVLGLGLIIALVSAGAMADAATGGYAQAAIAESGAGVKGDVSTAGAWVLGIVVSIFALGIVKRMFKA